MTDRIKCSFDFDGTLDRGDVQSVAQSLINDDWDVYIVTSRINTEDALAKGWHWIERQNQDVFNVAEELGIPRENIIYTAYIDKIKYLEGKGFLFHLDDDDVELTEILKSHDNIKPIDVNRWGWESIIDTLTDKNG